MAVCAADGGRRRTGAAPHGPERLKGRAGSSHVRPPRFQLVTDYVCGMTDTFACSLHAQLTHG
ncbi:hypothetical protein HI292_29685 [Corallococcus exiguus]|nr:hypothetical protein [Corallococcus exiguus]